MKYQIYFMQWKIFVHIDKSSAKEADCSITTLITASLTILPKNMSNEILKLLHGMKNLHSDENEVL